jgi:O-antigen ligase
MPGDSDNTYLERAVAAHVVLFIVGVSWAFGGNADWVRVPISAWGTLGIVLALVIVARQLAQGRGLPAAAKGAWPVVLLNAVVAASCLTPGFRSFVLNGETLLSPVHVAWWRPSTAVSSKSLGALWLFDGIFLSCLNIALVVRSRRLLRLMVAMAVGNAVVLAAFGVAQKVMRAPGIYFGSVHSPNAAFFSSFVYDNHWGSFMLLMNGACIGLVLRYANGIRGWGFLHGPALTGIACACLLAASVPLSGSRACTLLIVVQCGFAVFHGFRLVLGGLHLSGMSTARAYAWIGLGAVVAAAGIWMVVGDAVQSRAETTRRQVLEIWASGDGISRKALYKDTLTMARQRPLFGWGMGTFPSVFPVFNTEVRPTEDLPIVYHDAHSDWLQSLAEIGLAGTLLVAAAAALPAWQLARSRVSPFQRFLVSGCLLTVAYALVEFPFGNVAVVLSWWFCLFVAFQYMRLSQRERLVVEA